MIYSNVEREDRIRESEKKMNTERERERNMYNYVDGANGRH